MRVFVAGASGALGHRLVGQLIKRGHSVVGTYRSAGHEKSIGASGATPVQLDLLDAPAVRAAVAHAEPDAIVHQATALAGARFGRSLDRTFGPTNQLRTAGTDALVAAAQSVGVRQILAQSFAPYRYERAGGPVKTEQDRLDPDIPESARQTFTAMSHLEQVVTQAGGTALRYGFFYGAADPTTEQALPGPIRKRQYPVVGGGHGVMSFIHLDDAATATVLALERGVTGILNVVDDEPAAMREWVPYLARVLGAKPPFHVPAAVARLVAGRDSITLLTGCRGAANALARRELGWVPRFPSWRQGFLDAYGQGAGAASGVSE